MIHDLTIGHLDPAGIPERRKTVLKALEMDVVNRLLDELGGTDAEGNTTLGGARIRLENDYVVVPWLGDGRTEYPRSSRYECNEKPDA